MGLNIQYHYHKYLNPIFWLPASEVIYRLLITFLRKDQDIIEIGASSGHISYFLGLAGYSITLNEIRKDCIDQIKNTYNKHHVHAEYIHGDLFKIKNHYDFAWNTGLIQCFPYKKQIQFLKHLFFMSEKTLLIYPDTMSKNKKRGTNIKKIPGVDDAKEYSIEKIPSAAAQIFSKTELGELPAEQIQLSYRMYWLYLER